MSEENPYMKRAYQSEWLIEKYQNLYAEFYRADPEDEGYISIEMNNVLECLETKNSRSAEWCRHWAVGFRAGWKQHKREGEDASDE